MFKGILFSLLIAVGSASLLRTPPSIAAMMGEFAVSIRAAQMNNLHLALVDLPLPVTGGDFIKTTRCVLFIKCSRE
jgi:hypothetical protein